VNTQAPPSPAQTERATALAARLLEGRWHRKRLAVVAAAIGRARAARGPGGGLTERWEDLWQAHRFAGAASGCACWVGPQHRAGPGSRKGSRAGMVRRSP
jgi:hypothetical protein